MNIPEEHLSLAATSFAHPYSRREATFLWLVTAFSGSFLRHQWRRFAQLPDGRATQQLPDKLIANGHAAAYAWNACGVERHRYHVKHKQLYRLFGRENSNLRKQADNHLIDVRLCALDYVIDHQDANYLVTESDRVTYFREQQGVNDPTILPQRRYAGRRQNAPAAAVYFPDRFPLGLQGDDVVFTYVDHPWDTLKPLLTHLQLHRALLQHIRSTWRFVFMSADPLKVRDAERIFRTALARKNGIDPELLRHFTIEDRWQRKDVAGFTKDDYAEMGRLRAKYSADRYKAMYERWRSQGTADAPDVTTVTPTTSHRLDIYEPPTYRFMGGRRA